MSTSRLPGFYKRSMDERLEKLSTFYDFTSDEWQVLTAERPLSKEQADKMIENTIGLYSLPYGVGLNFLINGKDYIVPMAIEEPSVVASASHIAKIVREADGFQAETTERMMIGQIQILDCPDMSEARQALLNKEEEILREANAAHPGMVQRGGGAKRIEVRMLNDEHGSGHEMLIVHLIINTCDAMGANTINTMVETVGPLVASITGGNVHLKILSNYTDECLARATCVIPAKLLATGDFTGEEVRDGVLAAYQFAENDIYRAVTHNKGVMNGIDAVVIATGNDWRAIEAGAHAYASRSGRYRSMTEWSVDEDGNLVGMLELPMPVGIVGGSTAIHPMAQMSQKLLRLENAAELAKVVVSVGLAQNLGALKALATEGIQKGHMALHARSVAMAAGATDELVGAVADKLVENNDFRLDKARELLERMR